MRWFAELIFLLNFALFPVAYVKILPSDTPRAIVDALHAARRTHDASHAESALALGVLPGSLAGSRLIRAPVKDVD